MVGCTALGHFLIGTGIVCSVVAMAVTGGIPAALLILPFGGVLTLHRDSCTASKPVFAFHADSLEVTPELYSDPILIPYTEIVGVKMKRWGQARPAVRRPDGTVDESVKVLLGLIADSERESAPEAFRKKMQALGKME